MQQELLDNRYQHPCPCVLKVCFEVVSFGETLFFIFTAEMS